MIKYQAKDFIQTREGLVFAVVEEGLEQGNVLCFLRYQWQGEVWKKLATGVSNQLLAEQYPHYLFYSTVKSAHLHAVPVADITIHHQPKKRLQQILSKHEPDKVEQDLIDLCQLFQTQGLSLDNLGITGSLLIAAQNPKSDIDIVAYGRDNFHKLRVSLMDLLDAGKLEHLDEEAWHVSYQRRQCDLSYADYVWHEQRKYNKALANQRKIDLNLLAEEPVADSAIYEKKGAIKIRARVTNAQYAFDYPAKFIIDHPDIAEVLCYTATYTGQAVAGEVIEVAGQLEHSCTGRQRIIVGSTREARGEYIKVVAVA